MDLPPPSPVSPTSSLPSPPPSPLPSPLQCILYKLLRFPRLQALLENEQIRAALEAQSAPGYVDSDGLFDEARNCDYSHAFGGITRERFMEHFLPFIQVCVEQQEGMEVRRRRRELSALIHLVSPSAPLGQLLNVT